MLEIKNLHASIDGKEILKGINLSLNSGEMHAIMGRNGSGKSTLSNIITGREGYIISQGDILFKGNSILDWSPEKRALTGIFMSFQYPVVIPGVNNTYFLKAAFECVGISNWEMYIKQDSKFMRPAEVDNLIADCSKANRILGWYPKTSFNEMVSKMVLNDLF